jgi:hypothetical protein
MLRVSSLLGPLLMLGYGVVRLIDGLDGDHGPGAAWTLGHLLFLAGLLTFGVITVDLYRLAPGWIATLLLVGTAIGLVAFVWTTLVDLRVGLTASTHAEMATYFHRWNPPAPVQAIAPLFQIGLFGSLVRLAAKRWVPWWSPVCVVLASLAIVINLNLLPLGALLFLAALSPFLRPTRAARLDLGSRVNA